MMIMTVLFLLIALYGTALGQVVIPAPDVTIMINEEKLQFDNEPIIVEGRTMVPLRAIFEKLGAVVSWNADTQTIFGSKDERTVTLTIGSSISKVSGTSLSMDSPPLIVEGRTMVPVRFIAESLGANVEWDAYSKIVRITEGQAESIIRQTIYNGSNEDLRGLYIGQSLSQAESFLGKPSTVVPGPLAMEWRTYHNQYRDYYIALYSAGKIVSVFTNQEGESFAGISVGDPDPGLGQTAVYSKGSLKAVFYANDNVRIKSDGDVLAIYYLDIHKGSQVSGIRVISPELILKGLTIMGCQVRYVDSQDLPAKLSFCSSESLKDVMEGQSRISFELMNTARVSEGTAPLIWQDEVSGVAFLHSKDMSENNYFSHTSLAGLAPSDRLSASGIVFRMSGENISMQDTYFDAIESHYLFMNSIGHRKNILNEKLSYAGVGADYNSNAMYFTQNFITP